MLHLSIEPWDSKQCNHRFIQQVVDHGVEETADLGLEAMFAPRKPNWDEEAGTKTNQDSLCLVVTVGR